MAYSYENLRKLSRHELIQEHDRVAQRTEVGLNFFREELSRRDFEEMHRTIRNIPL